MTPSLPPPAAWACVPCAWADCRVLSPPPGIASEWAWRGSKSQKKKKQRCCVVTACAARRRISLARLPHCQRFFLTEAGPVAVVAWLRASQRAAARTGPGRPLRFPAAAFLLVNSFALGRCLALTCHVCRPARVLCATIRTGRYARDFAPWDSCRPASQLEAGVGIHTRARGGDAFLEHGNGTVVVSSDLRLERVAAIM